MNKIEKTIKKTDVFNDTANISFDDFLACLSRAEILSQKSFKSPYMRIFHTRFASSMLSISLLCFMIVGSMSFYTKDTYEQKMSDSEILLSDIVGFQNDISLFNDDIMNDNDLDDTLLKDRQSFNGYFMHEV